MRTATPIFCALIMLLYGCSDATEDGAAPANATTTQGVEPATISAAFSHLPEFSKIRTLLNRGGFSATMGDQAATITLLAPRDSAFAQLPPAGRAAILAMPAETLAPKLRAMMINRTIHAEELRTLIIDNGGTLSLPSMAGTPISFRLERDLFIASTAGGASASMGNADIATGNGAIYILDHWVGPAA
ncbi:MAG: fasciclin domain-containing protein [Sphingopyxis sp.]